MFLLAIFVPFSYFMDRLVWRSHEKRLGERACAGAAGRAARRVEPPARRLASGSGQARATARGSAGSARRSALETACRSPGSKVTSVPTPAVDDRRHRTDRRAALDDDHPRALAHLMVAHLLTRLEADRDRACTVVGRQHGRVDRAAGRLDLDQVPRLHGATVSRRAAQRTPAASVRLADVPAVVDQLPLGPLATNCYLVRAERGRTEAVVVDPSGPAAEIRLALASRGARCAAILVTHGHFDHILGLADLAEGTGAPGPRPGGRARAARDPAAFTPPGFRVRAVRRPTCCSRAASRSSSPGCTFDVLAVPGHSPGHLAYAVDGALLSGDVLFAGSVGRTDFPGGDWPTLLASIRVARRPAPARDRGLPRARARRRRSARSSRATRSSRSCATRTSEAAG